MILAIAATLSANSSMCAFYIKQANKSVKLANNDRTGYMRDTYLQAAINAYINAQANCTESQHDIIQEKIDQINRVW